MMINILHSLFKGAPLSNRVSKKFHHKVLLLQWNHVWIFEVQVQDKRHQLICSELAFISYRSCHAVYSKKSPLLHTEMKKTNASMMFFEKFHTQIVLQPFVMIIYFYYKVLYRKLFMRISSADFRSGFRTNMKEPRIVEKDEDGLNFVFADSKSDRWISVQVNFFVIFDPVANVKDRFISKQHKL